MAKIKAVRALVYSRVVSYYTPVDSWNNGKKEEFKDRQYIDVSSSWPEQTKKESKPLGLVVELVS